MRPSQTPCGASCAPTRRPRMDISVEVEDGVAYLRGVVSGVEDAENAEEIAGRMVALRDVVEEPEVGR